MRLICSFCAVWQRLSLSSGKYYFSVESVYSLRSRRLISLLLVHGEVNVLCGLAEPRHVLLDVQYAELCIVAKPCQEYGNIIGTDEGEEEATEGMLETIVAVGDAGEEEHNGSDNAHTPADDDGEVEEKVEREAPKEGEEGPGAVDVLDAEAVVATLLCETMYGLCIKFKGNDEKDINDGEENVGKSVYQFFKESLLFHNDVYVRLFDE